MFDDVLIESAGRDRKPGTWVTLLVSAIVHVAIIGAVVAAGLYVHKNPEVIEKPIRAFMVQAAPPPPPPPPPAASHASAQNVIPHVETPKTQPKFHQPTETPREVPVTQPSTDTAGAEEGGVAGGVKGGVKGGVVGGVIGGQIGGQLGGQLGGQVGAEGTGPMHVGGDVKAPVKVSAIEPEYPDPARKARIQGIVVIEAVIDRDGNVTDARLLKDLPLGLGESALRAVRRWKFKPGTLNGQPVPVYYTLTVTFNVQ